MRILFLVVSCLLFAMNPTSARLETADVVFNNGNIYTVNERQPHAEAIAVRGRRIVFVGASQQAQPYVGKSTRIVDLRGAAVVPGLTDSHYHLAGVGEREISFNLEGTSSLADLQN